MVQCIKECNINVWYVLLTPYHHHSLHRTHHHSLHLTTITAYTLPPSQLTPYHHHLHLTTITAYTLPPSQLTPHHHPRLHLTTITVGFYYTDIVNSHFINGSCQPKHLHVMHASDVGAQKCVSMAAATGDR